MILPSVVSTLQHEAARSRNEICGLISTDGTIYPVRNVENSPRAFLMHKQDYFTALNQINANGQAISALYHSHPKGTPDPSPKDMAFFRKSGMDMLIVTPTDWRYLHNE